MQREVWMPVLGYEGIYEVSNLGKILRVGSGRILAPSKTKGYNHVSLSKDGKATTFKVSNVVLSAFCGPKPFPEAHVAHNDGVSDNDMLVNLRWATPWENQQDVDRHGRRCKGEDVHCAKLTEADVIAIRKRIRAGERNQPIAEDFGVSISTIHLIRHNKIWRHVND